MTSIFPDPMSLNRATSAQPLGILKIHPYSHIALFVLLVVGIDRVLTLPFFPGFIFALAPGFSLIGAGILYPLLLRQSQPLQKQWGSLNLHILELATAVGVTFVLGLGLNWLSPNLPRWSIPGSSTEEAPVFVGLTELALVLGGISLFAFPWIVDALLTRLGVLQFVEVKTLENHSPEAAKLLRQFFHQQRRLPLPSLGILPSPVPIVLSYGLPHPGTVRIVMSQGVLDRLAADEIASLYALELGYLQERSSWILPWLVFLLQIPYVAYWFLATWGDRFVAPPLAKPLVHQSPTLRRVTTIGVGLLHSLLGGAASISYGLFKLIRLALLPLSRQRCYYGDRWAAALTGNPNGYSRALLHLAQAHREDLETRGYTHPWLESLELLLPLGYTTAATLSQAQCHFSLEQALAWDTQSPYRYWLSFNSPHPPTGDRLRQLQAYADRWNIAPEWVFPEPDLTLPLPGSQRLPLGKPTVSRLTQATAWWRLGCQALPYTGIFLGLGLGLSFWFLSAVANLLGWWSIGWVLGNGTIVKSCLPLGIGLGILLRNNFFFPNLPRRLESLEQSLPLCIGDSQRLPLAACAIQTSGTLIGRTGLKNVLNQDLWLKTATGVIRLHYAGVLGVITALWPTSPRPAVWIGQSVRVSGWLRRGATVWLNIIHLDHGNGLRIQSFPGLATVLLAGLFLLWGYRLFLQV